MKFNLFFLLWLVLSVPSPINLFLSLYSVMFSFNHFTVYKWDQQLQRKHKLNTITMPKE